MLNHLFSYHPVQTVMLIDPSRTSQVPGQVRFPVWPLYLSSISSFLLNLIPVAILIVADAAFPAINIRHHDTVNLAR